MRDYPVSILRVEQILAANTLASANLLHISDRIDDGDFKNIIGRLGVINTRMGLLVSCHDVPELRSVGEMIDPQVEERFFLASEEFIFQVNDFVRRAGGNHVQA